MVTRRRFFGTAAAVTLTQIPNLQQIGKTPHTKFAVNVEIWWKDLPLFERLERVAELGYRGHVGLELWPSKDEITAAMAVAVADVW